MLRPTSGIISDAQLSLWSFELTACGPEPERRSLRASGQSGRLDLQQRSEHVLDVGVFCELEMAFDPADPSPLVLTGYTPSGTYYHLDTGIQDAVIQRPMAFDQCEQVLLVDPDRLLPPALLDADTDVVEGAEGPVATDVAHAFNGALWMGSRADAEREFQGRWLSAAPTAPQLGPPRCTAGSTDSGHSPSDSGAAFTPGGGPGCSAVEPASRSPWTLILAGLLICLPAIRSREH